MILRYRCGQLWKIKKHFGNRGHIFQVSESHDQTDLHIVGKQIQGATFLELVVATYRVPTFKALYIARHDQALRLIPKAVA